MKVKIYGLFVFVISAVLMISSSCAPKQEPMGLDEMKMALEEANADKNENSGMQITADNIYSVKQLNELVTIAVTGTMQPIRHAMVNTKEDGTCVGYWHPDKRKKGTIGEILPGVKVKKDEAVVELQALMFDQQIISLETQLNTLMYGVETDEVNEVEAMLNTAELNYNRMKELLKKDSVTSAQFDQAKMAYDQALSAYTKMLLQIDALKKNLAILKERQKNLMVRAPFDGRIQKVYINPGEKASSMTKTPIFELVDDSQIDFTFGIPEEFSSFINKTTLVKMKFADGTTSSHPISSISPFVQQNNRNIQCQVRINNSEGKIQAGIFAQADVTFEISGYFLPATSLISDEDKYYCFLLEGTEFIKIPVKTGITSNALNQQIFSAVINEDSKVIKNAKEQFLSFDKIPLTSGN